MVAPADARARIGRRQRKVVAVLCNILRQEDRALSRRHQPVEQDVAQGGGLCQHDGQVHVARLGPEAVAQNLEPGDRIQVEYLVGVAVRVLLKAIGG